MKNYQQHLKDMTTDDVASANVAIDYLNDVQREHLEKILNNEQRGITNWKDRGLEPVTVGFLQKIIERSAKSYDEQPERKVMNGETEDEAATEYYRELLSGLGNQAIDVLDLYARLLKTGLMLVQYIDETGKYDFTPLHRGTCDVSYNKKLRKIDSIMFATNTVGLKGGQVFTVWTEEEIIDIEVMNNYQAGSIISRENHPYGIVPVAVLRDINMPINSFWPPAAWNGLVRINEIYNEFQTEMRFASKRQAFPSRITNAEVKGNQVEGVDSITLITTGHLGDQAVFFEHTAPSINLDAFKSAYADLFEDVADNWGVKLEVGGTATADSGFQLIVQENNSLETRRKRLNSAMSFEAELFDVISTIEESLGMTLKRDMEIIADFAEPSLAVDSHKEAELMRMDYAAGLITLEDWLRWKNPDMPDTEIEKRIAASSGIVSPNFNDATGN